MARDKNNPLGGHPSLKNKLKERSRNRRVEFERMAVPGAAPRPLRNDRFPILEICYVPRSELRYPARRVRVQDPVHVREVAASIMVFGILTPLLVGDGNEVIDGVVRMDAAALAEVDALPIIRVGHLSPVEQKLARLVVNRLGEKGQWNLGALQIEFEELILVDAPLEDSGFSPAEIDQIVIGEELSVAEQGPLAPDSRSSEIAREGDMFLLGPHRVICGNAVDPKVYEKLLRDDPSARLVFTDVPYNVRIPGNVTSGGHQDFQMASGEMSEEEFLAFNISWIGAACRHLCEGGVFGTFIDWRHLQTVSAAALQVGLTPLNLVVWSKTNPGMGGLYRSQHEHLPLLVKGDAPYVNNVKLGKNGRSRSNVWVYPGASSLSSDARRGLQDHPTVKPVAMLADALLDLSNRGEIVVDCFLGSGSTLIAAERTGRECRGIEISPLYIDVIIRRYEGDRESRRIGGDWRDLQTACCAALFGERHGSDTYRTRGQGHCRPRRAGCRRCFRTAIGSA